MGLPKKTTKEKVQKMKKKVVTVFGKREFLLGKNNDGKKVYLEEFHWDCDWYWGIGYLETFTNDRCPEKSQDIDSHSHFDVHILRGVGCAFDNFKAYFKESVLTDDEIGKLCDLMASAYTLRRASDLFHCGHSYLTDNNGASLHDDGIYNTINKEKIPLIKAAVEKLLTD